MQRGSFFGVLISCAVAARAFAAAPIELELAAERGVQITAPQEWLQLLTAIGVDNVRIRAAQPADRLQVENRGTDEQPRYYVAGMLTARNQLVLPGGTFSRGDRDRLKAYFERLAVDGGESLTTPRGLFGLTQRELESVFADLAQPLNFETKNAAPHALITRLKDQFDLKFTIDPAADRALRQSAPVVDELKGLTAGTGLAIALRGEGLVLRPEKTRGEPIVYRVAQAGSDSIDAPTMGRPANREMSDWPIGWELEKPTRDTAPSLFEFLHAEIDGYTLEETLAAIGPRLKIPLYVDHASLAAHHIEPAKVQVRLARTRTFYKRVIDRALAQARLGSEVRIDEAGTPFLWITR